MAKQTFTTGQVLTAAQMTSLQQTAMLGGAANAKIASYVLVAADAGDAITMSNAGATTITVDTGLFAAGDIVTIINIGAGACTITAGTATVTTSGSLVLAQNQGGVLRFTSPSAAIFLQFATPASGDIEGVTAGTGISGGGTSGTVTITNSMATEIAAKGDLIVGTGSQTFDNLTVGANNTVLTADSTTGTGLKWASASSGALVYVTGATFTSVSSFDLPTNTFTSTYRNYQIFIDFTSGGGTLQIRVRSAGTTYSGGNYEYGNVNINRGGTVTGVGGNSDTAWKLGYTTGWERGANVITVYNAVTSGTKITTTGSVGTGDGVCGQAGGHWQNAKTGIDSLNFSTTSGTMSGAYRVYGLADA